MGIFDSKTSPIAFLLALCLCSPRVVRTVIGDAVYTTITFEAREHIHVLVSRRSYTTRQAHENCSCASNVIIVALYTSPSSRSVRTTPCDKNAAAEAGRDRRGRKPPIAEIGGSGTAAAVVDAAGRETAAKPNHRLLSVCSNH